MYLTILIFQIFITRITATGVVGNVQSSYWSLIPDYQLGQSQAALTSVGTFAGFGFSGLAFAGSPITIPLVSGWQAIPNSQNSSWATLADNQTPTWQLINTKPL